MNQTIATPRDVPILADASSSIARWFVISVCTAAFAVDIYLVRSLSFDRYDLKLHQHFMSMIGPHGQRLLAYFTLNEMGSRGGVLFGVGVLGLTLLLAVGFVLIHRPWSAITQVTAVAGIYILSVVLKVVIDRPGPLINNGDIGLRTFPSGHTATGAALFLMAGYLVGRAVPRSRVSLMAVGVLATMCVSLSALTFHFPSEVFGGLALAGAWLLILTAATGKYLAQEPVDHIGSLTLPFGRRGDISLQAQRANAARSARERRLDRYRR